MPGCDLELDQPIAQTQAAERLGLGRPPEGLQPAVGSGQLEGGPVDVRGQVLSAHEPVRIVAHMVAVIGPQQAGGSKLRVVQRGGWVPVVDDHRQPALQSGTEPPSPGRSLEPDLSDLALDQLDPDARQRRRQVGRRWREGDLGEPAIAPIDVQLEQLATAHSHAMDRQGIEELVGQDHAGHRGRRVVRSRTHGPGRGQSFAVTGGDQSLPSRGLACRAAFDRLVAHRLAAGDSGRSPGGPGWPARGCRCRPPPRRSVNSAGRSSRSQTSSTCAARVAPKIGWSSGAVR